MKTYAICNQKGGVGKTTTTLNLALALVEMGKRVLLIDADQQGNLSSSVIRDDSHRQSLSELIHYAVADMPLTPELFITPAEKLDIVKSSKILAAANSLLGTTSDSNMVLPRAIRQLTEDGQRYDFVLIDCAPALDLLVVNALNAADGIIIPTEPANYSMDGILGVVETMERLKQTSNHDLKIEWIVINKFDGRKKNHVENMSEITDAFGSLVYPAPVPYIKEVEVSTTELTAMGRNRRSKAWPVYQGLAAEVVNHG